VGDVTWIHLSGHIFLFMVAALVLEFRDDRAKQKLRSEAQK